MSIRVNTVARAAHGARRRAKTRQGLIDAAIGVVAQHGSDLTIERVALAAKVSRGTFYNYFPSLDQLLVALVEHLADEARQDLATRLGHITNPAQQLAASAHYYLRRARREPLWAWAVQNLQGLHILHFPTVPRVFRSIHRRGVASGDFQNADPTAANVVIAAALRAAQRSTLMGQTHAAFDQDVVAFILAGLGMPFGTARQLSRETVDTAGPG